MNVVPNEPLPEETIDLRVWVRTLWGHRWILAVSVLAGGSAGDGAHQTDESPGRSEHRRGHR